MQQYSSLTLPWPVDWPALFRSERPLILEIGFGRGAFLIHLVDQFPDANIIGLEINNRCLVAAERTIRRRQLDQLIVIHSRAETALHHLFVPQSLQQIYINFPDPWFKSDHRHRRLMQRDTIDALVSRLQPRGGLYLATDILEYAEMSAELLEQTPGLTNLLPTRWTETPLPGRVITKYEAKAAAEGRTSMYFAYQRNDHPAPDVPVIREIAMPHIVFQSPVPLDEIQERFAPIQQNDGSTYAHVMNAYRSRHTLLFEVHLHEPTIEQHTALLLTERKPKPGHPQEYTLQMSTLGHPRPTQGMHYAVGLIGDWLLSLHPDARRVISNVASAEVED